MEHRTEIITKCAMNLEMSGAGLHILSDTSKLAFYVTDHLWTQLFKQDPETCLPCKIIRDHCTDPSSHTTASSSFLCPSNRPLFLIFPSLPAFSLYVLYFGPLWGSIHPSFMYNVCPEKQILEAEHNTLSLHFHILAFPERSVDGLLCS